MTALRASRSLAWRIWLLLGFGPTDRPPRQWSWPLITLAVLAVLGQLGDVVTTLALLGDPARPYAIEANPLMAAMLEFGPVGFIACKLVGIALVGLLVHVALRRGLPKTAYSLTICWLLIGLLLTVLNGSQLMMPPFPIPPATAPTISI